MKFFIRFFIVVAVLILIAGGIFWWVADGPGAMRRINDSLQATSIQRTPTAGGPQPTPVPRQSKDLAARQAATAAGVTLEKFVDSGFTQDVVVSWRGDNNQKGAEFLDALLRIGVLQDFEETAPPQVSKNRRGENEWRVQYRLRMN